MSEYPITRAKSGKPFRCLVLRNGGFTILDEEDYEYAAQWKWRQLPKGYVCRGSRNGSSAKGFPVITRYLHRAIAERGGQKISGLDIDHKNRMTYDNRRCNLLAVTPAENNKNRGQEIDEILPDQLAMAIRIAEEIASAKPPYGPIELSRGYVSWVSLEDFEWVMQWPWCWAAHYAMRKEWNVGRTKKSTVYMHVEIGKRMGISGPQIDHRDLDKLNNRRENLRPSTQSQNLANVGRKKNNTSGYKGVTWQSGKWVAQIKRGDQHHYLGRFSDPAEAHEAYKKAALELFGEFARFE